MWTWIIIGILFVLCVGYCIWHCLYKGQCLYREVAAKAGQVINLNSSLKRTKANMQIIIDQLETEIKIYKSRVQKFDQTQKNAYEEYERSLSQKVKDYEDLKKQWDELCRLSAHTNRNPEMIGPIRVA